MGRIEGFSTVITGGASGMGRSTVELFIAEGAHVVVGDMNKQNGEALVEEMRAKGHGDRIKFVQADVSLEADVVKLVEAATSACGRLDVMFNNAGIDGAFGPLTEIQVEHWDMTFAVMARGVFLGIKHAARVMKTQEWGGSIINTASLAALTSGAGPLVYASAKAACLRVSQAAALELGRYRIRVNTICPGIIYTPLMHRGKPEKADIIMRTPQPLPFRGEGKHIAYAALFLASTDSEFVTGDTMVVDGGLYAVGPVANTPMVTPSTRRAGMAFGTTGKAADVRDLTDSK
jgi:NAD(P)-dependent dehydrogenase (short-subunit alcohol dehydrogenase family)